MSIKIGVDLPQKKLNYKRELDGENYAFTIKYYSEEIYQGFIEKHSTYWMDGSKTNPENYEAQVEIVKKANGKSLPKPKEKLEKQKEEAQLLVEMVIPPDGPYKYTDWDEVKKDVLDWVIVSWDHKKIKYQKEPNGKWIGLPCTREMKWQFSRTAPDITEDLVYYAGQSFMFGSVGGIELLKNLAGS